MKVINALKAGINSKRGIQDHSGLSWGSCSPVINNLLDQKVIVSQEINKSMRVGKGRKTMYFRFNRKRHLLMGMEIDNRRINSSVTTLGNEFLGSYLTEFEEGMNSKNIVPNISKAFLLCREKLALEPKNIYCVSFSIPGAVDVDRKVWQYCERVPGIRDVKFKELRKQAGLPGKVYMQHNIHAHAYSVIPVDEIDKKDYVFIHVGQGMAMSANMGGILYGYRGFAGEIGHIPYPFVNREIPCLCGKKNCLEAILNKDRILEYTRENFGYEASSLGELKDDEVIEKVAREYILGPLVYIATIISNIFDPNRLIIEGTVLEPFRPFITEELKQRLRNSAWLTGPAKICWYKSNVMDGSFGAVLHSSDKIVNDFINDIDLDH